MQEIKLITQALPYRLGNVNCYLVDTGTGFVLIDTLSTNRRVELESELAGVGCEPGDLRLIILTHGDFDHTGNAAYLRKMYGALIAMHPDDAGMVENGDMFWNRNSGSAIIRLLAPILFRFRKANRFQPDLYLQDGDDLADSGFDAQILSIPGHSRGSIGVLTAGGDLFCGDLLENTSAPATNSIMDDPAACDASIQKLLSSEIYTVYPGHGEPFAMTAFLTAQGNDHEVGE